MSAGWRLIWFQCQPAVNAPVRDDSQMTPNMIIFPDQVLSRDWVCVIFLSPDKTYAGVLDHEKLFRTTIGKSLKCKSENLLLMSSQLQVKLVPMQMQAFSLPKGRYGKGDCSAWCKELQQPENGLMFRSRITWKSASSTLTFTLPFTSWLRGGVLGWLQQAGDPHHHRGRRGVSHHHRRVDLPVHQRPSQRGIRQPLSWSLIRVELKPYAALTYEDCRLYIL